MEGFILNEFKERLLDYAALLIDIILVVLPFAAPVTMLLIMAGALLKITGVL